MQFDNKLVIISPVRSIESTRNVLIRESKMAKHNDNEMLSETGAGQDNLSVRHVINGSTDTVTSLLKERLRQ